MELSPSGLDEAATRKKLAAHAQAGPSNQYRDSPYWDGRFGDVNMTAVWADEKWIAELEREKD